MSRLFRGLLAAVIVGSCFAVPASAMVKYGGKSGQFLTFPKYNRSAFAWQPSKADSEVLVLKSYMGSLSVFAAEWDTSEAVDVRDALWNSQALGTATSVDTITIARVVFQWVKIGTSGTAWTDFPTAVTNADSVVCSLQGWDGASWVTFLPDTVLQTAASANVVYYNFRSLPTLSNFSTGGLTGPTMALPWGITALRVLISGDATTSALTYRPTYRVALLYDALPVVGGRLPSGFY